MTISTEAEPLSYNGDDSVTPLPVTWKYFSKSDVVATHRDANDTETVWVLDTDYTLTDAGVDAGGELTPTSTFATGEKVVITLEPPNTQDKSIPIGGLFSSQNVEDGLDLSAQRDSKINEILDRGFRVPKTDTQTGDNLEIPIDTVRASKFFAFDGNGKPIASTGPTGDSSIPVSAYIETLLDDETAAIARTTLDAVGLTGDETIAGDKTFSGANTHSGDNTHSGANAFTAKNVFSDDVFFGEGIGADYIQNIGFTVTENTPVNGLTVDLKTLAGTNPTATDKVQIAFRSATLTSSTYIIRDVTSALSAIIDAGATLGFANSETGYFYVYAIDNAGVVELAFARQALFDESTTHDTTILSATSDSDIVLYSEAARTGVAVRLIGKVLLQTGATAGNWPNAATRIEVWSPSMRKTGDVVQIVSFSDGEFATGTTIINRDNSIPQQSAEGDLYMSKAITPTDAYNTLHTQVIANAGNSSAASIMQYALFQDSTENALAVTSNFHGAANTGNFGTISHTMLAGTENSTTLKLHIGSHVASTTTFNGASGARLYGGVSNSSIVITEIAA